MQEQSQKVHLLVFNNIDHSQKEANEGIKNTFSMQPSTALSMLQQGFEEKVNTAEIVLKKPAKIQLIRIVKPKANCHPSIKQLEVITQTEPIKNLEIFFRDLANPDSRFKLLINPDVISDKIHLNFDVLIPLPEGIITDHLIIRGQYTKMTLAIYGQIIEENQVSSEAPLWLKQLQVEDMLELKVKQNKINNKTQTIEEEKGGNINDIEKQEQECNLGSKVLNQFFSQNLQSGLKQEASSKQDLQIEWQNVEQNLHTLKWEPVFRGSDNEFHDEDDEEDLQTQLQKQLQQEFQ